MRYLLFFSILFAQEYPFLVQQHFIGHKKDETPLCGVYDGGLFWIGGVVKGPMGLPDGFIVVVDSSGKVLWRTEVGGVGADYIYDVVVWDTLLFFCGASGSQLDHPEEEVLERRSDFWLGAIGISSGRVLWQKRWGSPYPDRAYSLSISKYRTLLVAGHTWAEPSQKRQAAAYLLDLKGEILRSLSWGQEEDDEVLAVRASPEGFFWIAGLGEGKAFLAKVDFTGNLFWRLPLRFHPWPDKIRGLLVLPSGSVVGYGSSQGSFWAFMAAADGGLVWDKTYPKEGVFQATFTSAVAHRGRLYLLGYGHVAQLNEKNKGGQDLWLMALTMQGRELWSKTYGGGADEKGVALVQDSVYLYWAAQKEDTFTADSLGWDIWWGKIKLWPCDGIPVQMGSDTPSFREKKGQPIRFYVQWPAGLAPLYFEWDLGDGTHSHEPTPTKVYEEIGTYQVRLRVRWIEGCEREYTYPKEFRIVK
ncbi:MAG: PKD domain-containing protein [Bacteroidia bacterium]